MISVAMATFNGEKYIEKQLLSIYQQTKQPDEVIIYDDCSTDKTPLIIEAFIEKYKLNNWRLTKNDINCGYVRNFTKALSNTNGDIIFLSDQDDIWYENKIEFMSSIMEDGEHIALMTSELRYIDCQDAYIPRMHIHTSHLFPRLRSEQLIYSVNVKHFCSTGGYQGMTMAIRRNIISVFLSLDPSIITCHDRMLGFIASTNEGMFVCSKVLNEYRLHENNVIGLMAKDSRKVEDRVCTLKDLERDYESYLAALPQIPLSSRKKDRIAKYLENMIQTTSARWIYLQSGQTFKIMAMIRKIYYFQTIRTFLGDIFCSFKEHNLK